MMIDQLDKISYFMKDVSHDLKTTVLLTFMLL